MEVVIARYNVIIAGEICEIDGFERNGKLQFKATSPFDIDHKKNFNKFDTALAYGRKCAKKYLLSALESLEYEIMSEV